MEAHTKVPHRRGWLGPGIVALIGVTMLTVSWGTWPDPIVDFGRELYVPWRLANGEVLYRDIVSYFNGPLSPYLHAGLFKVFGASLRTLVWFNLLNVAALTALLYVLLKRAAGELVAASGGVAFVTLFAFAQYTLAGNYNYVCPYSYELTHGLTLSAGAIYCMIRWQERQHPLFLALSGAMLGLVFLTKAEVFAAAVVPLVAAILANLWIKRVATYRSGQTIALFLGSAIVPIAIAFGLLLIHLSAKEALLGLAGSWRWIGDRSLLRLPYFAKLAGTDDIAQSLITTGCWLIGYLLVFGLPTLVGLFLANRAYRLQRGIAVTVLVVWLTTGLMAIRWIHWGNFIRPLPLLLGAWALIQIVRVAKRRSDQTLPLILTLWALALLAKTALNAHIYHYGFALGMPATLVGIALCLGWFPRWMDRASGGDHLPAAGNILRGAVLATLIVVIVAHVRIMRSYWVDKVQIVGTGSDAFYADPERGVPVQQAIEELHRIAVPQATVAVVPEGLIINYLARRINPTSQLNFTPPAMIMYGESAMLDSFRAHPPDFIFLTGVQTTEYGASYFGTDYGNQLAGWIRESYDVVRLFGPAPFRGEGFGIVLFARKSGKTT